MLEERIFSLQSTFDVYFQEKSAIISRMGDTLEMKEGEKTLATANLSLSFPLYYLNVNIEQESQLLAKIEQTDELFYPWASFCFYANNGEKIATAEMNFLQTRFSIRDVKTDELIAELERPPVCLFSTNWTVMTYLDTIDPRVLSLFAAAHTSKDNLLYRYNLISGWVH